MGSGCPHSQGGAYPVSQHKSNVCALTSPQDNNVALMPVIHPVNGIQHNMIATEYPVEGRMSYSPPQWQQGNTHSKQNVKGLHQLESPASILRTGCQHPTHGDCDGGPRDSCSQINSVVSSKCRRYLGTSANENSVKQSVYNGGPESECSKGKGSNVCINTEKDIGAAAQTFSLQHLEKSHPLLFSLTVGKPPDLEILMDTHSSQSKKTNVKMKLNTSPPFSDGHLKSQQMKCSLAAPNCDKTSAQNLNDFGVMHSSPSTSHQPSTEKVSPVGETMPLTDEQIKELIEKQVAHYRKILTQINGKYGRTNLSKELDFCTNVMDFTFQFDSMPKSNSAIHLPTSSPSVKEDAAKQSPNCAVIEKCATAVAQALDYSSEDTKANAKLFPKSENTEYPQIKRKVAATCTKTEDECPVVLTAVIGMTLDELTENHPSPLLNCSSSQEESKSFGRKVEVSPARTFNISKNLDGMEQMSGRTLDLDYPLTIKHMMEREKRDTGLKPVEAVGLDNVQSVTAVSEDLQTKSRSEAWENAEIEPISLIESQGTKMKNIEDHQDFAVVDAYSEQNALTYIQIHNVVSLVEEQPALSESDKEFSVKTLNVLQYEDISDDEKMSQRTTELPNTQHVASRSSGCYDPQYENVSEDENLEKASLTQESEPNYKLSSFEKESSRSVQDLTQMTTEIISDEGMIPERQVSSTTDRLDIHHCCSAPRFAESDNGAKGFSSPKCDCMRHQAWQTNHSVSCSPSSLLKDDNTDNQLDDDWMIFPISISDLKREDEDQYSSSSSAFSLLDDGETGDKETQRDTSPAHGELHRAAPPFFSLIEEFDTKESFKEAMRVRNVNMLEVAPGVYSTEHEPDSEEGLHTPQKKRESYSEPEDSCDTDDSCNYPCGSERNYMTVSSKVSAPLAPDTVDSGFKKEGEDDEVANMQKSQTRNEDMVTKVAKKIRELMDNKHVSKHVQGEIPEKDDVISIDSDTEDENDQNCEKAGRKRLFSSGTDNSGNVPCSQQKRLLSETEGSLCGGKEKFKKSGLPSTDSPASQHQSMLCDQHNGQKISREESVITISSDSEDDFDQNYTKAKKRRRLVSSGSSEGSDTQCDQQDIRSPTTVNSAHREASPAQHQSKRHDTHLKGVKQGACSDQPDNSEESKQLTEAEDDSEHIVHNTNRSRFSAGRRAKRMLSSKSGTKNRHSTESVDSLCGTANKMPKTKRLSSKDSTKKQAHSAIKKVDSSLGTDRVILRLLVQKSTPGSTRLRLVKESTVQMQGNDVTWAPKIPTEPNKKTENNPLHGNMHMNGNISSKSKPAIDRQHSTKNKEQAKEAKPRHDSRPPSLPSEEGPSTSIGNSSTSRQLSEVRQNSASTRGLPQSGQTSTSSHLPKPMQHKSTLGQQSSSSNLQPTRSHSNSSTLNQCHTSTNGPSSNATTQLPALVEARKKWKETYIPTSRDRKSSPRIEEDSRTTHDDSSREARPGPSHYDKVPRRRRNSHKSETPMMKKSKSDAIKLTKARHLDASSKQSSVGDNYKWSEKPKGLRQLKGSGRFRETCRGLQDPHY